MDFAMAFKRPFLDVKKLIIGIALSIIPIVNFFAIGYVLEAIKNKKAMKKLPEWDNWGRLFGRGFFALLIGIIYGLPAFIAFALGTLLTFGGWALGILSLFLYLLGAVLILLAAYVAPAAVIRYAQTEGYFNAAFQFKDIFHYAFRGDYFVGWLIGMIYIMVLSTLVGWVPIVGPAFASFTSMLTMYTLLAEA